MSTNNKHKISEKELDNLLGQAFLNLDFNNPKNEELMETLSNQVLPASPVNTGIINKALFTKLMGLITIIIGSIFTYILFFSNQNKPSIKNTSSTIISSPNSNQTPEQPKQATIIKSEDIKLDETKEVISRPIADPIEAEIKKTTYNTYSQTSQNTSFDFGDKALKNEDSNYVFPKLTEKEIKENHKRKKEMIDDLAKISKDIYLPIPSGTLDYKGQKIPISKFYMETTEVSNLEYLTFILDLIIQNKKEDFLKAKPNQSLWVTYFSNTSYDFTKLKESYFSDKAYWNYPVVNITREGAEMFCNWLSSETNKYLASKNKIQISDFRLPTNHEWLYAARSGTVTSDFPWKTDSIQNRFGCFLANFNIKNFGEVKRDPKAKCKYNYPNAITSAGTILDPMQTTVMIDSYNPNDFGLYCISGNASEMVYEENLKDKSRTHGTRGGSWYSETEQLKLTSENEFKNITDASPLIGFRPIFRIIQKQSFGSIQRDIAETGLQTLTSEEILATQKEKKKMIEALVKFNKDKYAFIPMGSYVYKNDTVSVQYFYMETTEVTNLEYRTFLADLLIQNKTADYLIAKPNQEMWVTKFPWSFNEPMRDMYFWHPAYDEYPVVNISRKGAELYCKWLTVETNNYLKANNKPLINDLRIPVDIEWAYAANNGYKAKYASGHNQLRDSKGKFEVNYMCYSKEQCKYDSVLKLYVPKNKKELEETNTNAPKIIDDGGFHTVYGKSYAPNNYGLFCMAGNVSEMVYNFDLKNKKINGKGTKGGSWFSCDYYLEIDADEEYPSEEGPSPLIGFRPVMTALKK
jgi:formylglycine-generating enzyme required for sulfatase activity